MKIGRGLLVASLAVAALVAVVATGPRGGRDTRERARHESPIEEAQTAAPAETPKVPSGPAPAPIAAPAEIAPSVAETVRPAHVLVVRLVNFDATLLEEPKLRVRALLDGDVEPFDAVRANANRTGETRLDVSSLFRGVTPVQRLDVSVDHPGYDLAVVGLNVPAAAEPPVEHRVDVTLRRAGILTGKVLEEGGAAAAGAVVSLFRLSSDAAIAGVVVSAVADAEGRYRIRRAESGRFQIVATKTGWCAASDFADVEVGAEHGAPTLVLTTGVAVEGHVRLAGKGAVAGATVLAWRTDTGERIDDELVRFADGTIDAPQRTVHTDHEGAFRFESLPRGTVGVAVEDLPRIHRGALADASVRDHVHRVVTAPATKVDFDIPLSTLVVDVRSGDQPVPSVTVMVQCGDQATTRDAVFGPMPIVLVPGASYKLSVTSEEFAPYTGEGTAGGVGEERVHRVDLEPRRPRPSLVVTVRASDGAVIGKCSLGLWKQGSKGPMPTFEREERGVDNRFRFTGLEPGRYRMVVRPGANLFGSEAYWSDATSEIDIPDEGDARASVDVDPCGRIRIGVKRGDGHWINARCIVRDAAGEAIPVSFTGRDRKDGVAAGWDSMPAALAMIDQALRPGGYRLEVSADGFATQTVDAIVRTGETTIVTVNLVAK